MSPSQIIVLAIPVFILLIVAELAYGVRKGRNTYRLADAINSISPLISRYRTVRARAGQFRCCGCCSRSIRRHCPVLELQSTLIGRNYPHPGLGCGPFGCQRTGQALYGIHGERN